MAKYIGLLTSDIRGKIGGTVFGRARGGSTIKAKTLPKYPQSQLQRQRQSTIALAQAKWRALAPSYRTTWNVYAASLTWSDSLGGSYSPTGQQLYTQAWSNAALVGGNPPNIFPSPYVQPWAFDSAEVSVDSSGNATLSISGTGTGSALALVFTTRSIYGSVGYTKTLPRRYMGSTDSAGVLSLTYPYTAAYGSSIVYNDNLALKIVPYTEAAYISGVPFYTTASVF